MAAYLNVGRCVQAGASSRLLFVRWKKKYLLSPSGILLAARDHVYFFPKLLYVPFTHSPKPHMCIHTCVPTDTVKTWVVNLKFCSQMFSVSTSNGEQPNRVNVKEHREFQIKYNWHHRWFPVWFWQIPHKFELKPRYPLSLGSLVWA